MRNLSEALRILYAPASIGEFPSRVHQAFGHLINKICVSFDEIDIQTGVVSNSIDQAFPISDKELLERWTNVAMEHPGVRYYQSGGSLNALSVSGLVSQNKLRETAFYRDFWKVVGVRDQIFITLPVDKKIIGVGVNNDVIYSPDEVFLMELLQPHFVQAYRTHRIINSISAELNIDYTPWRKRGLTRRECEVLRWLMDGKRNSEIAIILGMKPYTAKTHVERILEKLGVENRTAAAAMARRLLETY